MLERSLATRGIQSSPDGTWMRFRRVPSAEALGYWQSSLAGLPSFARLDGSETRPHTGSADYPQSFVG